MGHMIPVTQCLLHLSHPVIKRKLFTGYVAPDKGLPVCSFQAVFRGINRYSNALAQILTLVLLNLDMCPTFANSVDPDQLASEEAN